MHEAAGVRQYDISLSSFKRHKKGWANFKVEAGAAAKPEDYFLKIPSAGRPTFLSPDEEQLIAEMLAGMGDLACGKQTDRTLALICRVADAVGNLHVKGSRSLFTKFMVSKRPLVTEQCDTNTSPLTLSVGRDCDTHMG